MLAFILNNAVISFSLVIEQVDESILKLPPFNLLITFVNSE